MLDCFWVKLPNSTDDYCACSCLCMQPLNARVSTAIQSPHQPVLGLGRAVVVSSSAPWGTTATTCQLVLADCSTILLLLHCPTQARRHPPPPPLPFPSLPPAQPRQMPGLHLSTAERLELTRSDRPLVCPSSQFSQYPAYHPTPGTHTTILVPKILTSSLFSYL